MAAQRTATHTPYPGQPIAGWALVTGASSGIGRAVAAELASRGYGLFIVSEDEPGLDRAAAELHASFATPVHTICVDLTERDGPERVHDQVKKILAQTSQPGCNTLDSNPAVSVLANCAGIYVTSGRERDDPAKPRSLLDLHVGALSELCFRFGRDMIDAGGGYILNVSSVTACFADPSSLTYGASKTYIRAFSRAIRLDWREHGIRVTCLMPSGVKTSFHDRHHIYLPKFARHGMITPERCALAGVRALLRGRAELTPGLVAKLQRLFYPLLTSAPFYQAGKRAYRRMLTRARSEENPAEH